MGHKVFLHAGKHKCGSSSIQTYLDRNVDFFAANACSIVSNSDFPEGDPGNLRNANCFRLAHIVIRPELATPIRLRHNAPVPQYQAQCEMAAAANSVLHDFPTDTLVISAEAFSFLRTPRERQVYDILFAGFDIVPIVFFRDPKAWMASWQAQISKTGAGAGKISRPAGTILDFSDDSWLLDDQAIREFFGPQTVSLSYEAALQDHGSVIPAFLSALGLPLAACPPWDGIWKNRSR